MILISRAFDNHEEIPQAYTCIGKNISPPLEWKNIPAGTKSLVLIVDDPDAPDPKAPRVTWVHWVVYNIPSGKSIINEDASGRNMPEGAVEGVNDWKKRGYGGPCPPVGRHRYFHKLYALDTFLDEGLNSKQEVEEAMKGHILAHAELVGLFKK